MTSTTLLLVTVLVIMLAAMPLVAVLKTFLPNQIEKAAHLEENENRIYVLHSEIHEAQSRLNGLTARRNQRSGEIHRLESEARKADKTIRDIENQPPLFVHEVGEPRANLTRYQVNLTLTRSSESRSAPLNPIWRCANMAEVWAATYEEAKQAVETTFPFKLGYNKSFIKQKVEAAPAAAPVDNGQTAMAAAGNVEAGGTTAGEPGGGADKGPARELRRPAMRNRGDGGGAAAPPAG